MNVLCILNQSKFILIDIVLFDCFHACTCDDLFTLTCVYCRTEDRAAGWILLTREILELPETSSVSGKEYQTKDTLPPKPTKDKRSSKLKRPQPLIKLVMRRFINITIFCSAVSILWSGSCIYCCQGCARVILVKIVNCLRLWLSFII